MTLKGRTIYTESDFAFYAILPIFSMQTIRKFYFNKCNQNAIFVFVVVIHFEAFVDGCGRKVTSKLLPDVMTILLDQLKVRRSRTRVLQLH